MNPIHNTPLASPPLTPSNPIVEFERYTQTNLIQGMKITSLFEVPSDAPQTFGGPNAKIIRIEGSDGADNFHFKSYGNNKVAVEINGESFPLPMENADGGPPKIQLLTKSGDDNVTIDADVFPKITIESYFGNNTIQTGGGAAAVHTGYGMDNITLGPGGGTATSKGGNNTLTTGTGTRHLVSLGSGKNTVYTASNAPNSRTFISSRGELDTLHLASGNNSVTSKAGIAVIHETGGKNEFAYVKGSGQILGINNDRLRVIE